MAKRFLGAAIVIVVVGLGFYFGGWVLDILLGFLAVVGLFEVLHNTHFCENKVLISICMIGALAIFAFKLLQHLGVNDLMNIQIGSVSFCTIAFWAFLGVFIATAFVFVVRFEKIDAKEVLAVPFAFLYACLLIFVMGEVRSKEHGLWLCGFMLMPFVSDVFAYFFGRWFGKRHPLPVLSPNKTIAGFVGGFVGGILVGALYALMTTLCFDGIMGDNLACNIGVGAVLGLFSSFFAEVGDLFSSAIKRKAGIKDFGNLIPGHGGVIDRFDSVLLWAPVLMILF